MDGKRTDVRISEERGAVGLSTYRDSDVVFSQPRCQPQGGV